MDNSISKENDDSDLDPRIQIELEKLNSATDDINKLEIELDEANTTFRMLLNESTRRLKLLGKKLGSCIDRARPYYEALEVAKKTQLECQKAAVLFQRANEIHAAAKETVALAEQRFMSNQHEWQFDNAWQEMLNHATIKVTDAETQRAASGREHQARALAFQCAEQKVQQLEERLRRHIIKSRPYFEEKCLCQDQLNTQKERIESLQKSVAQVKFAYSQSLKTLELISEEIHRKRKKLHDEEIPNGPREPGVGAELNSPVEENPNRTFPGLDSERVTNIKLPDHNQASGDNTRVFTKPGENPNRAFGGSGDRKFSSSDNHTSGDNFTSPIKKFGSAEENPHRAFGSCADSLNGEGSKLGEKCSYSFDLEVNRAFDMDYEIENCGAQSLRSVSATPSSCLSEKDENETADEMEMNDLRMKVKQLAVRPIDGVEGCSDNTWESELNATVDKLDHMMLMKECVEQLNQYNDENKDEKIKKYCVSVNVELAKNNCDTD